MPFDETTHTKPSFDITVTTASPLSANEAWKIGLAYAPNTKTGKEARTVIEAHHGENAKSFIKLLEYMRGYNAQKLKR